MTITFNEKNINIPDDEIKIAMDNLQLTQEEAIELWLDDNGYTVNEEQVALTKKASTVKINHDAQAPVNNKTSKPRNKKEDFVKKAIISAILDGLKNNINDFSSISVRNDEKYIDFTLNNVDYTVNLVAHRGKKE